MRHPAPTAIGRWTELSGGNLKDEPQSISPRSRRTSRGLSLGADVVSHPEDEPVDLTATEASDTGLGDKLVQNL